jgi:hypothetical protein
MSSHASSAIVPVSASDISRRSYEQKYLIEEKIVLSLIDTINQGIRDQVSHGLLQYEFFVPSLFYGFPRFDSEFVCTRLRDLYRAKGFHVTGVGPKSIISWKDGRVDAESAPTKPPKPKAAAAKPTPPSSSATKRIPLLLLKST